MNRSRAAIYDAWYNSPRGAWLGGTEARALIRLGRLGPGMRLLDVGCGTGWFTRRFAAAGCEATGLDRDPEMIAYARARGGEYLAGDMLALPVPDKSFDIVTAVTSLCFVTDQRRALTEMLRVARDAVLLGLLHRYSLLYLSRHGSGAYAGAHWHTRAEVGRLIATLPGVRGYEMKTLLFWSGGPTLGRALDGLPGLKYFGAFLAVRLTPGGTTHP